jgi:hypothetical protein
MYKITVERNGKKFLVVEYLTLNSINKERKALIRKYKLKRQKGFWANLKTGKECIELYTNY